MCACNVIVPTLMCLCLTPAKHIQGLCVCKCMLKFCFHVNRCCLMLAFGVCMSVKNLSGKWLVIILVHFLASVTKSNPLKSILCLCLYHSSKFCQPNIKFGCKASLVLVNKSLVTTLRFQIKVNHVSTYPATCWLDNLT